MQKKNIRIFALTIAAIAIIVWIIFQGNLINLRAASAENSNTSQAPTPTAAAPEALPVTGTVVQSGPLKDVITVNGATLPDEEVAVSSEVSGKIQQILFQEGSTIKKGKELVRLDNSTLQAERKRLVVEQKLADKIEARMKALYDKEGVSLQEYEVAAAEVEKLDAQIALVDAQLEKMIIKAPFSGILGLKQVSEGSYLSPGDPIVHLVKTNPIKVEFSVPEKFSQIVKNGNKINFSIDGVEGILTATVVARASTIDPDTRTLQFLAQASNSNGSILPGAFASVQLQLQQFEDALMVPTQAIIPELGGKKVYVYRNGQAQPISVETGIRQEAMIQVVQGLTNGDTVITSGILQIRPGMPVRMSNLSVQTLLN